MLVVGAGPAGLTAARRAARERRSTSSSSTTAPSAGGTLTGTETIDGRPSLEFVAETVAELAALPNVTHLQRTTAFGHYDDGLVLALERRTDHIDARGRARRSRQRVHRIRAARVVIAAGAIERPIVFEDNDRPGVMLAASARDFLHRHGVLAGREVVVFTSDDAAYAAAVDLHDAGAAVRVFDARSDGSPVFWSPALRGARHRGHRGHAGARHARGATASPPPWSARSAARCPATCCWSAAAGTRPRTCSATSAAA